MISQETGRILMTDIVCNVLRTVMHITPEDLLPVVYLSTNRIAPAHKGLELGLGESIISKALAKAYGRNEAWIRTQYLVQCHDWIKLLEAVSRFKTYMGVSHLRPVIPISKALVCSGSLLHRLHSSSSRSGISEWSLI